MRIVVADDDLISRRLLQALLTSWGHEVVLAADGVQALQILRSHGSPNLALLDWMMPGMDGLEVVRKVREGTQSPPPYVILLSAREAPNDVVRGLEAGADDYIKKPFDPAELRARIQVGVRVLQLQGSLAERVSQLETALGERQRAEAALRESEQRYRLLFDEMLTGFALLEVIYGENGLPVDHRYLELNAAFESHTGLSRASFLGKTIREALPTIEPFWIETYGKVATTGESMHVEKYSQPLQRWFEVIAFRPRPGQVAVTFADITSRKQIEHVKTYLASIVESSDDAIIGRTLDGTIVSWNKGAEVLYGYRAGEIIGRPLSILAPADRRKEQSQNMERINQGKRISRSETVRVRKDGTLVDVSLTVSPIRSAAGEVTGAAVIARDITERKRAEEALRESEESYRLLFSAIPHPVWVFDLETGGLLQVNGAAVRQYGYSRQEFLQMELSGLGELEETPVKGGQLKGFDPSSPPRGPRTHRTKDGRTIDVELESHAFELGGRKAILIMAQDVTERKQLELELRHAQKLEAVGGLAAGIAHEINTPIQFIGDNARFLRDSFNSLLSLLNKYQELAEASAVKSVDTYLLEEVKQAVDAADLDYLTEEIPKALGQSLDGLARVATIVRAMKEFAHPDRTQKAAADLNKALASTLIVARNELKHVADIETDLGDLPPVLCHLGDMNQVFLNLVVNAAHAVGEVVKGTGQKGKIQVLTRVEGDSVLISISDTGCGIPPSIQSKVFEPFFTTKEVGKGTGQGLAIARSIVVDKHGGSLTFQSEVGRGTTFEIRLPVSEASTVRETILV